MSQLTEPQKRDFSRRVAETAKVLTAALTEKGFDPASRITQLGTGAEAIDLAVANQAKAEAAAIDATRLKNTLLNNQYNLASATVDLAESLLGKDNPNVRGLRQIRTEMSPSPGTPEPEPAPPAKPA